MRIFLLLTITYLISLNFSINKKSFYEIDHVVPLQKNSIIEIEHVIPLNNKGI